MAGLTEITRALRPWLYSREYSSGLQAALSDATEKNIRRVTLTGTQALTAAVTVPAGVEIEGDARDGAELQLPAGTAFSALDINGVDAVSVRNLRITKASGAAAASSAYGLWIRGTIDHAHIENVHISGLARGINVSGVAGSTPGTVGKVTLERVTAEGMTVFGISVDECDVVELLHCVSRMNALDGAKLRRKTKNVLVLGGVYEDNGQDYFTGAGNAGDGLDAFAGGDRFTISDAVFRRNNGNGITIKTDSLTMTDAATYGYIRNAQISNVRCLDNVLGDGLGFYTYTPSETSSGDAGMPMPDHCVILGGEFSGNNKRGLYLNGRSTAVVAPIVRNNKREGILVGIRALHTTITNPLVSANSREAAGTYSGIYIRGKKTSIRGGVILGADADFVTSETELAAATKYHAANVNVGGDAVDVLIDVDFEAYNAAGRGIQVGSAATNVIVHQRGTFIPNTSLIYGSPGSTYLRTDATDPADRLWIKVAGAPNAVGSWSRMGQYSGVTSKTAAYTATAGDDLILGNATSAAFTVTLPTAVGIKGKRYTVKKTDASANAVTVDGNGSETIDGALTKALGSQFATITIVSDNAAWQIVAQQGTVT
jgi:hypothetical protein